MGVCLVAIIITSIFYFNICINKINNMSKNYGTLTIDDITNAMNYAADQITRLKCEDKHIIDYMCDDGNVCMTYKEEDYNRKWMRPGSISSVKPCSEYTYGDHE